MMAAIVVEDTPLSEIEEANEKFVGSVGIRKTEDRGWGIFALADFKMGDIVMRSHCLYETPTRTKHSVQTDWNKHVQMDLPARFINHVCNEANVGVRANELGAYDFLAIRAIQEGEELLWDYETVEYEVEHFGNCYCGTKNCRKVLKGFKYHKDELLKSYGEDFIAPYLLE